MPSDPIFLQTWKAIESLVGVNFAAGYSGLDLTNRVIRGSVPEAPMIPFCAVLFFGAKEEFGQVLTRYQGDMTFELYGFCGGGTVEERIDNATRLSADLINALTSDRTLGLNGLTDDVLCSFEAIEGDRFGIAGVGIAYVEVIVKFQADRGV